METLGEFLKRTRECKNLRLDDIASKTRIRITHLEALETNQFKKIPSEVIARGFVRSYVRCVGADENEALSLFDQSARSFFQKQRGNQHPSPVQTELIRPQESRSNLMGKMAAGLSIGLIFMTLYLIDLRKLDQKQSVPVTTQQETNLTAGERLPEPKVKIQEGSILISKVGINKPDHREKEMPLLREPELLQLTIEAVESSWVSADIDGNEFREVLLRPGDKISWVAQERFTLNLGNAGGVKVHLNEKPLGPFGPSGMVVRNIILISD